MCVYPCTNVEVKGLPLSFLFWVSLSLNLELIISTKLTAGELQVSPAGVKAGTLGYFIKIFNSLDIY